MHIPINATLYDGTYLNESPVGRASYSHWNARFMTSNTPKLALVGDPGAFVQDYRQLQFLKQSPNLVIGNVGGAAHFPFEEVPFNVNDVMFQWLELIGILN